jgi:hypothetical protein
MLSVNYVEDIFLYDGKTVYKYSHHKYQENFILRGLINVFSDDYRQNVLSVFDDDPNARFIVMENKVQGGLPLPVP